MAKLPFLHTGSNYTLNHAHPVLWQRIANEHLLIEISSRPGLVSSKE